MLDSKLLQALGGWEGYVVERVQWPQGDSRTVSIYLKPQASVMHCERCGAQCSQVHETTTRRVRNLARTERWPTWLPAHCRAAHHPIKQTPYRSSAASTTAIPRAPSCSQQP